jgi:flagellar protein FlgJ
VNNLSENSHIGTAQFFAQSDVVRSTKLAQQENNADLEAVADQFEAIFIESLLKQARESKLSESLFDTNADDNFIEMFDRELANTSSKLVDIGIAEAIIRQMSFQKNGVSS